MGYFAKETLVVLLVAVVASKTEGAHGTAAAVAVASSSATTQGQQGGGGETAESILATNPYIGLRGPPQAIQVGYPAAIMTPIMYACHDYKGPYDPLDPLGKKAAFHRLLKLKLGNIKDEVHSFFPPGLAEFVKKEFIKFAINEGRKFATKHPKEAADLIGIITKVKKVCKNTKNKLEDLEEEEKEKLENEKCDD